MLKPFIQNITTVRTTDWVRKLSMMALLFSLVSGVFIAIFSASRPQLGSLSAFLLFATVIVVSLLLAQLFFDLEGWSEQHHRDMEAQNIFNAISQDDVKQTETFILYLRPFISTNKIGAEKTRMVGIGAGGMGTSQLIVSADRIEFEEEIEKALRPLGKLIALGKPLEHMGAGRVLVADDVWQNAIKLLIDKAEMIVLLPSPRPGTCWEVEHILTSGALKKTIVIDPPNDRGSKDDGYDPVQEWAGVRETFLQAGYELPEDDEAGSLILFGDDTQPIMTSKIGLGSENQVRKFAKTLQKKLRENAS